jgi:hypothetical protein
MVVVDPVNAGKGKAERIHRQGGKDGEQARHAGLFGHLELKHHNGDDDRDDAV